MDCLLRMQCRSECSGSHKSGLTACFGETQPEDWDSLSGFCMSTRRLREGVSDTRRHELLASQYAFLRQLAALIAASWSILMG